MGFLWGLAAVSLGCGVSVGLAEAPTGPAAPAWLPNPADLRILMTTSRVTQRHRSDLLARGNSAPIADYLLACMRPKDMSPETDHPFSPAGINIVFVGWAGKSAGPRVLR